MIPVEETSATAPAPAAAPAAVAPAPVAAAPAPAPTPLPPPVAAAEGRPGAAGGSRRPAGAGAAGRARQARGAGGGRSRRAGAGSRAGPQGRAGPPAPARSTPVRSGWIVQVGAFGSESEAKQHLEEAQSKAKKLLGRADPFTEAVTKGDKTYYRARFAGLERDQAEATCKPAAPQRHRLHDDQELAHIPAKPALGLDPGWAPVRRQGICAEKNPQTDVGGTHRPVTNRA